MKKIFLFTFLLAQIYHVKAFELSYSDWSREYPDGVKEILIESEDRYLCYSEKEENVEYLIKEFIGDKLYDEDDIKIYESDELFVRPEEYSERIITEYDKEFTYSFEEARGILINKLNSDMLISEIEVVTVNNENVPLTSNLSYLTNNDISDYTPLDKEIKITFDKEYDLRNLIIKMYFNKNIRELFLGEVSIINSNDDIMVSKPYAVTICQNPICMLDYNANIFNELNTYTKKVYKYEDTLYKTYTLSKEYTSEYVTDCCNLTKDEDSKVTYYRYITNDYIIIDMYNHIVTNDYFCIKNFCMMVYVGNKEEEITENEIVNPKTYDPISDLIIIFVTFSIFFIYFIVKLCQSINKSNIVESISNEHESL